MENIFSASEEAPEVDPAFQNQVPANYFNAPPTRAELPAPRRVEVDPIVERNSQRAGERVQWRTTRIAGWSASSLVDDALRIAAPPNWWTPDPYGQVFELLDRAARAVGVRDGAAEENHWAEGRPPITSAQIAAAQEDEDEIGELELTPTSSETITEWFARISAAIDFNTGRKPLRDGLRSYAARFRGDANAKKTLDARLVRQFLKTALN